MSKAETTIRGLLELAEIEIDGSQPRDLQVNDPAFYQRVLSGGPLGLGEAYMDGLWDCEALDEFIYQVLRADLEHSISPLKL
ncbi:MAG TPA: cyclopropane-fatty-acyl-phospholipid synthase, partial [Gammaproteobacteria bacterium]|nr:cyclopropane-fatty-acyl-phospholipid synthase [Gammaproteobacteria bacterium]